MPLGAPGLFGNGRQVANGEVSEGCTPCRRYLPSGAPIDHRNLFDGWRRHHGDLGELSRIGDTDELELGESYGGSGVNEVSILHCGAIVIQCKDYFLPPLTCTLKEGDERVDGPARFSIHLVPDCIGAIDQVRGDAHSNAQRDAERAVVGVGEPKLGCTASQTEYP